MEVYFTVELSIIYFNIVFLSDGHAQVKDERISSAVHEICEANQELRNTLKDKIDNSYKT